MRKVQGTLIKLCVCVCEQTASERGEKLIRNSLTLKGQVSEENGASQPVAPFVSMEIWNTHTHTHIHKYIHKMSFSQMCELLLRFCNKNPIACVLSHFHGI